MRTLELSYMTARGAYMHKTLRDAASTEIEANLYLNGNREERVGGVDHAPGQIWNGRTVQWTWWFDPAVFESTHTTHA